MDFYAVLDQVVALLRSRGRASYRALKRQFALDDGHIAQYLGDGLLVYFGYPRAHEDDAQRAVRAGLGMVQAIRQLNTRLARERGVSLAIRLGLHTGQVVVGEIGGGATHEQLALGETPNLAARLQGLAAPDTLVISAATLPLLGGFFACQSLGTPLLKGFAQPIEVYQVRYESTARRQEVKLLELRAAMSLCRLWQQQGKHAEVYGLLAPIYGWFTEGFDTADLQDAKALLEELAG